MVTLRAARSDEADSLTALALRSKRAWGYDEGFMARVMPDMIVHAAYLELEHGIVAEESGSVVGYAIVRVDREAGFLRDLFVEPDRFRNGIGRMLFDAAVEFARERGAARLELVGDPHAVAFYKQMGMRQTGEEPSIAGGGRMLPLMRLEFLPV